jgi:hypothetical protein
MNDISQHSWNTEFFCNAPLFDPVRKLALELIKENPDNWPGLTDYQRLLDIHTTGLRSQNGAPVHFVDQAGKPLDFEDFYEARIYLKGEVQTRTQNWHDFFQVLIWCQFPRIKTLLNSFHYQAALKRHSALPRQANRNPLENAITLFDECGIIIASSDPSLLDLIRRFQWKELFWHRRDELDSKLHCIVFGHALYEKALQPYIGMTGNALLINTEEAFLQQDKQSQLTEIDAEVSDFLTSNEHAINTRLLTPFPLLGMPGWDKDNQYASYYDNAHYFRNGRHMNINPA